MRVIIEAALFASKQLTRSAFEFPAFLDACLKQERHHIEIEPPDAPEIRTWREAQTPLAQDEFDLLLDESVQRQLRDPSTTVIRVADVSEVDWRGPVPRLPLTKATLLLNKPLRVLIEGIHDEAFLKATVPHMYRARFESWFTQEFLKTEHQHGLENMHHALDSAVQTPEQRLRMFVMIDSDARRPGEPSQESKRVAKACAHHEVPHHALTRRSIENYIPWPALEAWLKQRHARDFQEKWWPKLRAFRALSDEQRHHYNMKRGLKRDREGGGGLADLFDPFATQNPGQPHPLEEGFTDDVAQSFTTAIPEDWLTKDGQRPELMRLFETMLLAA